MTARKTKMEKVPLGDGTIVEIMEVYPADGTIKLWIGNENTGRGVDVYEAGTRILLDLLLRWEQDIRKHTLQFRDESDLGDLILALNLALFDARTHQREEDAERVRRWLTRLSQIIGTIEKKGESHEKVD